MKRVIFLLIVVLSVFGAGCNKKTTASNKRNEPLVYLPPSAPEETEGEKNLRELREAIDAFRDLRTYRSKLSIGGKGGTTSGQIDIVKPDRFHGTMQVAGQASEVIGIANTLYVRLPDGNWSSVQSPALTKAMTEAFRSSVDGDNSVAMTALSDDAVVTKQADASRDCDLYKVKVNAPAGTGTDLNICVAKGLPKIMELHTSQGDVSVEYFDFNKLFVIEKPAVRTQ